MAEFTLSFNRDTEKANGRDAEKVFTILYQSVRMGRTQQREAPGIDVVRSESRIRRALEQVSVADTQGRELATCEKCAHPLKIVDEKGRKLSEAGGVVTLRAEDFDRLKDYLEKKVLWSGDAVMDVADAADFLIAAKEAKA